MSKIVIALGGNALQINNEASALAQEKVARSTIQKIIPLVKAGHEIVIVHGNGPQVGNVVLHEESIDTPTTPTMPLHVCVAMTQGMIGYWLQKALNEELRANEMASHAVSIVTQIEIDAADPAFDDASKPIGPFYTEQEAKELESSKGYIVKEDAGRGWRRVVASPKPKHIIETEVVKDLMSSGTIVVAGGGGGVPVVKNGDDFTGTDAIIDKDFVAELLAREIGADTLLILTGVDNATINYGTPEQAPLGIISASEARQHIADSQFAPGSMLPKIEAAANFAEAGGRAIITSLENAENAIKQELGTVIK
ncbi:MAG: carbamate kinase [Candidatus Sacchiramonaceae bacterium]|nr:carbamate kinase [Candidatus Saccharimonadaceae bacterium]